MDKLHTPVKDANSLQNALQNGSKVIEVDGVIDNLDSFRLPEGTQIKGLNDKAELHFKAGQPGLILSANNVIKDLRLVTDIAQIAIGLSNDMEDLGSIEVESIRTVGRFHLEANNAKNANIKIKSIIVEQADARVAAHRPSGFGVEVLLGAFTVLNNSKDKNSIWIVEADNISGGTKEAPLLGSGIFIFGGAYIPYNANLNLAPSPTEQGGKIILEHLTTGEIHSNGQIPLGTGNLITGGVFIGSGVDAKNVINEKTVTTYGANDMVLDNWGRVKNWLSKAPIVSYGASGIGFVNFGDIDTLTIDAPIITNGLGARGFNLYDGTLKQAEFQSITTHGDGAIGVQLSKPFGKITVLENISTYGGEGDSLVRGKVIHLKAYALSLKKGTRGDELKVLGNIRSHNQSIPAMDNEISLSEIKIIEINGKTIAQ